MNTENKNQENQNHEFQTDIVRDVAKSETDIYRISRKEYKGRHFVDLRIFFRAKEDGDRLIPTHKGICVEEKQRQDLIAGLISARAAALAEKPEGEGVHSAVVCDIPYSETEVIRISKGSGKQNVFVDVRRFFEKDGSYFPYKRKGVTIQESALDDVITGLMEAEAVHSA